MVPTILFLLIFAACLGLLYPEGMWTNALRLVNVVTAALLATNFWEPAARWLDDWQPSYTYVCDFFALWGLFALFMLVLRAGTDVLSRVKVKFLKLADRIGSGVLSACIGWVLVCFTATTLHTAPLAREFMFGGFKPESRATGSTLGIRSPEVYWLSFVQYCSRGPFARMADEAETKSEKYVFDPRGEFMPKYATRRARLEAHMEKAGTRSLRVDPVKGD